MGFSAGAGIRITTEPKEIVLGLTKLSGWVLLNWTEWDKTAFA